MLRGARIGVVRSLIDASLLAVSATGDLELVGVGGVTIGGTASVKFNNFGADVNQAVTFTNANGGSDTIVVEETDGARSFEATNVNLDVLDLNSDAVAHALVTFAVTDTSEALALGPAPAIATARTAAAAVVEKRGHLWVR